MEGIIIVASVILGIWVGGQKNMEEVSAWIKKNPCTEKEIGTEKIKKCYELVEIKK